MSREIKTYLYIEEMPDGTVEVEMAASRTKDLAHMIAVAIEGLKSNEKLRQAIRETFVNDVQVVSIN